MKTSSKCFTKASKKHKETERDHSHARVGYPGEMFLKALDLALEKGLLCPDFQLLENLQLCIFSKLLIKCFGRLKSIVFFVLMEMSLRTQWRSPQQVQNHPLGLQFPKG